MTMLRRIILAFALLWPCAAFGQQADRADGCVYQTTPPTLINNQFGNIQCDQLGRLVLGGPSATANSIGRVSAYAGTYTVTQGTITTGGTSQQAIAANTSRRSYMLCNVSSGAMAYNFSAAASATTFPLAIGQCVSSGAEFVSTQQIQVWGGTTGQAYAVAEGN